MTDIVKARNILKAQLGLQFPSNFKFNTSLQLPNTFNQPYQQTLTNNALSSISSLQGNPYIMQGTQQANPLLSNTSQTGANQPSASNVGVDSQTGITQPVANNGEVGVQGKQSTFQKIGGWGMVGQAADMLGGIFKDPTMESGSYGQAKQIYDQAASAVSQFNPVVGGIMKVGGFAADAINSIGGKRSKKFSVDTNTIKQVGSSYGGSVAAINNAASKANKKYGLFNSGARRRANREIDEANRQQNIMTDIADEATDRSSIAQDMSQLNYLRYQQQVNGGYDQRYMRAAKQGAKLKRIKKININKKGGKVNNTVDLNKEWSPIIQLSDIEEVYTFKNGGQLEWSPTIQLESFRNGGQLEWSPVITFQNGGEIQNKSRSLQELVEYSKEINPRFIQRLSEPIKYVEWVDDNGEKQFGTHELGYAEVDGKYVIFPNIQERDDKQLFRYTDFRQALNNALKNKNVLWVNSEDEAKLFTESKELENGEFSGYKSGWQEFFKQKPQFKEGGKTEELSEYYI